MNPKPHTIDNDDNDKNDKLSSLNGEEIWMQGPDQESGTSLVQTCMSPSSGLHREVWRLFESGGGVQGAGFQEHTRKDTSAFIRVFVLWVVVSGF